MKNKNENIVMINYEDEMKQSYIDYAMSVIVQRALPDVRDGLKPVHRRILYAMEELGNFPDKPHKKSARIVGDCFVKGTLVTTPKGLIPIEDLEIGDKVVTHSGVEEVTKLYIMPKQEICEVVLNNGFKNKSTMGQRYKVLNDKFDYEWIEARDLKIGDYVVCKSEKDSDKHNLNHLEALEVLIENPSDYRINRFKDIAENNIILSKVDSVEVAGEDITYDIQVLNVHEFIANGMLVHNCMGKYHPHGDSSIYGAMVRMSQDFSLRAPLVDGHGNFGSIDGDGAAAMRYCVTGDTLIATSEGLVKIENIVKDSELNSDTEIDVKVQSFNSVANKSDMFFNSGIHKVKKVKTKYNYEIKGSHNHPLLTLANINGKPTYKWKTLEELVLGDYLVLDTKQEQIESKTDYVTKNEAKFLGLMISEGYISNNQDYNRVGFSNSDFELADFVKEYLEKECLYVSEHIKSGTNFPVKEITVDNTKYYNHFIQKYGFSLKSNTKEIPNIILKSTRNIQSIFLRNLFEGDGGVSAPTSKSNGTVFYSSSSIDLINQLHTLLLQFEVLSSVHPDRDGFRIIISDEFSIYNFSNKIGFESSRKIKALDEITDKRRYGKGSTAGYNHPKFIGEYIRNNAIENKAWLSKNSILKPNSLIYNYDKIKESLSEEDYEFIKQFYSKYIYLPVTSIEDIGEDVVYSIRVNSDCHTFVGNGFINHNTEARLTPLATEMLQDLEKDIVDFKQNFDNTLKEPTVLPSKFPNLLVNGSSGIAVGMATSIPPHNLSEVMDASIALIDKPELTVEQLMKYVKGPDFPTGGIVSNKDDLLDIYKTGNGRVRVMAKLEVENIANGKKNIVVTEVPYTLSSNKTRLVEDLITLVIDKKLDEVSEVRDESSKEGMRIVIEVKRGVDIDNLKNKLYKITKLEDTFSVNLLAIKDSKPVVFSLKGILESYLEFLKEINLRKINYDLIKSRDRLEILEGLIKASDVIDLIIEIIRNSKDIATVRKCLVSGETEGIAFKTKKSEKDASKLLFTEKQATAILGMQLQRLVGLEIEKLNNELGEVSKRIEFYVNLIENEKEFRKYIKEDLKRIKKKYNTKRKTIIDNVEIEEVVEKVIEEDLYALIDKFNYLKVIDSQSYVRVNDDTLEEYKHVIEIQNTDNLCVFTDDGNIHQVKMSEIPQSRMRDRGTPIDNLFDIDKNEVLEIVPLEELSNKVVFITSAGLVKRVEKEEYMTNRKTLIATKINDDDKLIGVKAIGEDDTEIVLITEDSRKIRFDLDEVSIQKRNAKGVIGINLNVGDSVVGYEITPETDKNKRKRGAKGVVIEED